jgi:hypothetical protein
MLFDKTILLSSAAITSIQYLGVKHNIKMSEDITVVHIYGNHCEKKINILFCSP